MGPTRPEVGGSQWVLGVDFGTTRVKACGIAEDTGLRLATASRSWREAGLDRRRSLHWLEFLRTLVRDLTDEDAQLRALDIAALSVTVIGPSLIGVDLSTGRSGPLVVYDDPTAITASEGHPSSQPDRLERVARSLAAWTPGGGNLERRLMTMNGWLTWQLSGSEPTIDAASVRELGVSAGAELADDLCIPRQVADPWEPIGRVSRRASKLTGLPVGAVVAAGSSDSFALRWVSRAEPGAHLLYLGTWFSLMRCGEEEVIPSCGSALPSYEWVVSLPAGALLDRLSTGWFGLENPTPSAAMAETLAAARWALDAGEPLPEIPRSYWGPGLATDTLPSISGGFGVGQLAAAPIKQFGDLLVEYCEARSPLDVLVAGGVAEASEWLLAYLGEVAPIRVVGTVEGADGLGAAEYALRAGRPKSGRLYE
ncbi:MAG: hypothetical protein GY788_06650 [bacterium]|nr:hypothetical protein [bacterium]